VEVFTVGFRVCSGIPCYSGGFPQGERQHETHRI